MKTTSYALNESLMAKHKIKPSCLLNYDSKDVILTLSAESSKTGLAGNFGYPTGSMQITF